MISVSGILVSITLRNSYSNNINQTTYSVLEVEYYFNV